MSKFTGRTIIAKTNNSVIYALGDKDVVKLYGVTQDFLTFDMSSELLSSAIIKCIPDVWEKLILPYRILDTTEEVRNVTSYDTNGMLTSYYCSVMNKMKTDLGDIRVEGSQLIEMIYDLTECLAYCHSSDIVHGDIKPSNFLVNDDNEIFLCDIGSCFPLFNKECNYTRSYRAPEIFVGNEYANYATDVWALGASIFEMITDRSLPIAEVEGKDVILFLSSYGITDDMIEFADQEGSIVKALLVISKSQPAMFSIREELEKHIPKEFEFIIDVCMRCLNPIPELRYRNAIDVLQDFDHEIEIDNMKVPKVNYLKFSIGSLSGINHLTLMSLETDIEAIRLTEILFHVTYKDVNFPRINHYLACLICCNGSHPTSAINYDVMQNLLVNYSFDELLVLSRNIMISLLNQNTGICMKLFQYIAKGTT